MKMIIGLIAVGALIAYAADAWRYAKRFVRLSDDHKFCVRRNAALSALDVANRLHKTATVGTGDIRRAEMDMDDFVMLYLSGGWRIGVLLDNGDLCAVVNALAPDGQQGKARWWADNPLTIYRQKWHSHVGMLQDMIAAAIVRDSDSII